MINKKFLAPVLALVAIGLPARANVAVYCAGDCGGNTLAAFNSLVAADVYTYASGTDLTFTGSLSGGGMQYLDGATQVLFAASSAFTINADVLTSASNGAITFTVGAQYAAIRLMLSANGANDFTCIDSSCDGTPLGFTPKEIDYITDTPGSQWSVTISPGLGGEQISVNSFNPAGPGSETPEVGTLLLIGAGLIAMRWMPRRVFRTPRLA
jgi:hypothetical protein